MTRCRSRGSAAPPRRATRSPMSARARPTFRPGRSPGEGHVLFTASPGGAVATAARVAQAAAVDRHRERELRNRPEHARGDRVPRERRAAGRDRRQRPGDGLRADPDPRPDRPVAAFNAHRSGREPQADGRDQPRLGQRPGRAGGPAGTPPGGRSTTASTRRGRSRQPCATCSSPSAGSGARTSRSSPTTWVSATCSTCWICTTAASRCPMPSCTSTPPPIATPPRSTCWRASATTRRCITGGSSVRRKSCACTAATARRLCGSLRCRRPRGPRPRSCTRPTGPPHSRIPTRCMTRTPSMSWCGCPPTPRSWGLATPPESVPRPSS